MTGNELERNGTRKTEKKRKAGQQQRREARTTGAGAEKYA